jgi:hypothetical protein
MTVAETSIDRYHALMAEGAVSRTQALILSMMDPAKDYTRAELSDLTKLMINCVTGRVDELIKEGHLEEIEYELDGEKRKYSRKCGITGFKAKVVRLPVAECG